MAGDERKGFSGGLSVGYEITGHIFATGYIKGIFDAPGIKTD
jgi:hypothetical protein